MAEEKIKNQKKNLSTRLFKVASLVTPGLSVADVGCDHGWVPIFLIREGIAPRAYAMDVRKGPLSIAEAHVKEAGLEGQITLRLSDGLGALAPGEAESIIIAGMGGPLIRRILTEGEKVAKSAKELILSPHSEWAQCREYLLEQGYEILKEQMVEEEGKIYLIMKVRPCGKNDTSEGETPEQETSEQKEAFSGIDPETALAYGKELLGTGNPILREYLVREEATLTALLARLEEKDQAESRSFKRRQEILRQLHLNRKAFEYITTIQGGK